jgi:hypothetical protein
LLLEEEFLATLVPSDVLSMIFLVGAFTMVKDEDLEGLSGLGYLGWAAWMRV